MKRQKGFATITAFLVLSGLMLMSLYTSYVVYLQCCLQVQGTKYSRNNDLISSAELYVKHFVMENWATLQAESTVSGADIMINDFFRPHLSGCVLIMKNWSFDNNSCRIQFLLTSQTGLLTHRDMKIKKGDVNGVVWRSERV